MKSEINVPDGWRAEKLEDLLLFLRNGLNAKQKNHGKYMITRIETISEGIINSSRIKYVEKLSGDLVDKYRLMDGDILFSHINSTKHIGKTAIYNENNEIMIHGINLLLLRSNAKISSQFLLYLLKKTKRDHLFERIAKKAVNQASINTSQLKKIQFLVPPLPEQQKIADILSKVDEQIDFTEKIIDKTEELKKGLMRNLLIKGIGHTKFKKTELGEIPEEWGIKSIFQISNKDKNCVQTGPFGAQLHARDYVDEGVPFILIKNFGSNGLIENNMPRISIKDAERLKKYSLKDNDIVFSRVGRVGSCFLISERQAGWIISGQTLRIRLSKDNIDHKFLIYALQSKYAQNYLKGVTVGSTRKSINTKILESLKIVIPKIKEQKQIASILSKVDEQIQDNKKELKHLKELKKGLMQDLLTGKVRVSV